MTIFRTVILVAVAYMLLNTAQAFAAATVQPAEVRRWMAENVPFYLVDVRSAPAFGRKHITGAVNMPAFVVHKKGLPKDGTIVVYDSGIGSTDARTAAGKLESAGYGRTRLLEGGLARWEVAGYPLTAPPGLLETGLIEAITAAELAQAQKDGIKVTMIDLRDEANFSEGSIPGALNVAPSELAATASDWQKDSVVVLLDGGNNDGARLAEQLRRAGFKLVRFLYGGFPAWKQQNVTK